MIHIRKVVPSGSIRAVKRAGMIDSEVLIITDEIITETRNKFGDFSAELFIPLADHISFAIKRIKKQGCMSSPLTQDIIDLFPEEFYVAKQARRFIVERTGVYFDDDELGYITLHINSIRDNQRLSVVMQDTQLVRLCLNMISEKINISYDYSSLAFSRFLSHMKYLFVRMRNEEVISLDINEYMSEAYPDSYKVALSVCSLISENMKMECNPVEVGYMAMHIERIKKPEKAYPNIKQR